MAKSSNAFTTVNATVTPQDLADLVEIITPVENWFTSNTGRVQALSRKHDFPAKSLAAAASNASVEATDITPSAITAATLLYNYCQHLYKAFKISERQNKVKSAGGLNQTQEEKKEKFQELTNDIEYALLLNASAVSGDDASAAPVLKGVSGWITTNTQTASIISGTSGGVTETLFNNLLKDIADAGGKPKYALMGGFNRSKVNAFTGTNTKMATIDFQGELPSSIDVIRTSFGTVQCIYNWVISTQGANLFAVIDQRIKRIWRKAWLTEPHWKRLAETGFYESWAVACDLTLECLAENANGKISN